MQFLTGTYLHTIDDRGRIALPAKLRSRLGETVVVTSGRLGCLAIFPSDVWEATGIRALKEEPNTSDDENNMRLWTFSGTQEDTVDGQGRVSIPEHLRDESGLNGEVAIVGAGDHIQIWDRAAWITKRADLRKNPPNDQRPAEH